MSLELKHLAPYLPYGLRFLTSRHQFVYGEVEIIKMSGLSQEKGMEINIEFLHNDELHFSTRLEPVKPILHPLSDLTKEIEHNGERFVPLNILWNETLEQTESNTYDDHFYNADLQSTWICKENVLLLESIVVDKLIEWHFDVFGLIEQGLAIDINTIKK